MIKHISKANQFDLIKRRLMYNLFRLDYTKENLDAIISIENYLLIQQEKEEYKCLRTGK